VHAITLSLLAEMGVLLTFCSLHLPSSWDYRQELPHLTSLFILPYLFIYNLAILGFELRALHLLKQALYYLSHGTSPQSEQFINRNLFLTVLEAEKSKIKMPTYLIPDESSLTASWMTPSCCVLTW
jgi:hypothetical protein